MKSFVQNVYYTKNYIYILIFNNIQQYLFIKTILATDRHKIHSFIFDKILIMFVTGCKTKHTVINSIKCKLYTLNCTLLFYNEEKS